MARAVCDGDPRTLDQRRADALGAIGHRAQHLACLCGSADFPADGVQANTVVINAIAEERTQTDDTPAVLDGEKTDTPATPLRERTLAESRCAHRRLGLHADHRR